MKSIRHFRAAAFVAILCLGNAFAGGEGWSNDLEAAKKQATSEKKSLLLDFTGSDWCGWCIKLNKEVFDHDAFKNGVKDKLVLVEIDFPKDATKLTEEVIARNDVLKKQYAIKGFPTLLLTDERGRPFARTGYKAGGPEAYVTHLDELLGIRGKRDAAFAEAAKAEGVAKAKLLITAIQSMGLEDTIISTFYADEMEAIKTADPKDESGFLKGIATKSKFEDFQASLNQLALKKDFEGVMKKIDETLAAGAFEGELKQQVMIFKAITCMQLTKPEDALKTLDEAKAIAPESPVSANIEGLKKRIAATIPK